MKSIMVDFRICAAIINANQTPYENNVRAQEYINIINENMNTENTLADYVISNNLNSQRTTFVRMQANNPDLADFPSLAYEELYQ